MNMYHFKLKSIKYASERKWPFFWRKTKTTYIAIGFVTPNLNAPATYKDEHGQVWFAQDQTDEGTCISNIGIPPFKEPKEFIRFFLSNPTLQ